MPTADQAVALTEAYRQQQIQQGKIVAALVALYFRQKVVPEDPISVSTWIDLVLPRVLGGRSQTARLAAAYATALRRLEVPSAPALTFTPNLDDVTSAIKTSLLVVGPSDYLNKATVIKQLDVSPVQQKALLLEAKQVSSDKLVGATLRHVQNGGRQTLFDAQSQDTLAIGYVRVTKDKPCFFCAMLASRGLVFGADSFIDSDPRFTGDGTAKVHDHCSCTLKPVYTRKGDKLLDKTQTFTDMWESWGAGGTNPEGPKADTGALLRFRRGYDHWLATGEILDHDVVANTELFLNRSAA